MKKVERGGKGTEETGGDCFFYLKTKSCRAEGEREELILISIIDCCDL